VTRRLTVLVADDEAIFLKVLTARLTDEGYEVLPVTNQDELATKAPEADALVVDARLPSEKLEGLEVVASLFQPSPRIGPDTPILFISVHAETDDAIRDKLKQLPALAGRYRWLQKPFETDLLVELLRDALAQPGEETS